MKDNKKILSLILAILLVFTYNLFNKDNESHSNKEENNKTVENDIDSSKKLDISSDLKVYFIDVGQADSILISNQEHHMLIDAGNNPDGKKLVKYLKNDLGIEHFDYVVGTHPHEDHIGGLDDIIENFDIDNVYLPDVTTTTKTFEDVIDALEKKNLEVTIPEIGENFSLGEAQLEVIYAGQDTKDLNDSSIVLEMEFGKLTYLFTGDATKKVEEKILDKLNHIDVLKVAHHGSLYSSSENFLKKITPSYAIISVGLDNSYGHPGEKTLKRIKKYTDKIYMTNELGTILLTSDGHNIEMSNFKTDTNG